MLKKILIPLFVLVLTFSMVSNAAAQSYSFSLDKEIVNVFWNADGTLALDYQLAFTNSSSGHVIDFVDIGVPNGQYTDVSADVNGNPLSISSDFQGQGGSGFSVDMGGYAIQPGQSGTVHVVIGKVGQVLYPDDKDQAYASAVFSPNWFGAQFVNGNTNMSVTFHLPPGVKPEEPRWHASPSGFPSQPEAGMDAQGRVIYTWSNPSAVGSIKYTFGASFPKSYIPIDAIVTPPAFDFSGMLDAIFNNLGNVLCCGFFAFMFVGAPAISAIQGRNRKLQYMSPKVSIEGHGIKRGLTAVEAAILMEQPLDKVMTMILFGVVKKDAAQVVKRDPLELSFAKEIPPELHQYEMSFLAAFRELDVLKRRKLLQDMTVALVKSVTEKMKGFSRKETVEYYKRIMETAWEQVQKADTPEVQMAFFDQQLEWTMLDKDYDDRSRRTFRGPVYVPMWWGHYDPTYAPRSTPASVGMPSSGRTSLPGADFAASMVTGVQTFSSKVIGNVGDFTSRVTNTTNPPPKPSASSGRSGGGRSGGGCACACACAGCACACAGGGR